MEATLYPQAKKPLPWQLIGRVAMVLAVVGVMVAGAAVRSLAQARARAFAVAADVFMIRTGLEQYYAVRSTYPLTRTPEIPLGVGETTCLDDSREGFHFTCAGHTILATMPRPSDGTYYAYTKTASGYEVRFVLPRALGTWTDTNRDGRIYCSATEQSVTCE